MTKKPSDIFENVITGTFFLAINIVVTLVQYFSIHITLLSCVFFFLMTVVIDYVFADDYNRSRKKYRKRYYQKNYKSGMWIRFLADTRAMLEVYFVLYLGKLQFLYLFTQIFEPDAISSENFLFSAVLALLNMLLGARLMSISIDYLREFVTRKVVAFFKRNEKYFKNLEWAVCDFTHTAFLKKLIYPIKSNDAMMAIPAMKVSICRIACPVSFSLWSSGIRSEPAI